MTLSTGTKLNHYEISSQLGKGGMGEVYKAKDQKLGRDVAIKVLPEEFAKDADRIARFQREAKLLASLNHPNIASIYGLEESGGNHFLVLELIEGDTLADRIKTGPIPVEEALKLALQIAEALEAAHEKGVIHRDLKPANIKVTPEGKVKVLDFGLAKAFAGDQVEVNLSHSPTLSEAATMQGVILGTAAYMSPEQARGKPVDKRTDIWAFGCVLYEMLAGQAAFQGEDVTEILAAVVKSGVNLDLLPANLNPRVREVITRCLQKEQKKRYRDIGEAQYEIDKVLTDPGGVFSQPTVIAKPRKKLQVGIPLVIAALILVAILAGLAVWYLKPPEPKRVVRFDYELPEGQQFAAPALASLAVSPDGSQFAYCTAEGLYLRSAAELNPRLIPGTEMAVEPCFSPDGQWICYWSAKDSQLKKIAITGGAPVSLTKTSGYPYGSLAWGENDWIVYGMPDGIMRIPANGGNPELLPKSNVQCIAPQILPGGKSMLFTLGPAPFKVVAQSLISGERKELFSGDTARYIPTGHIVYALENNLFAIAFDPDRLEVVGGPVSLVEGIFRTIGPQYAVSGSGTLVYVPATAAAAISPQRTLVWVDGKGKEEPIAAEPNNYNLPKISPDGTKVALNFPTGGNQNIWVWDLVRKTMTRLTFDEAGDLLPLWSPDGKRIAFRSNRGGKPSVYWKAADGTGADELLASASGGNIAPRSWSGDGKTLVFMEVGAGTEADIGVVSVEGDRTKKLLLHEKYNEMDPQISPDGRWMAYASDESGRFEIYVRPYPEVKGGKWQVSTSGGNWPLWSRDGRELFYRSGDAFMAVSVKTEPTFSLETPRMMFRGTYASFPLIPNVSNWDISPDGKRFLMIKSSASIGSASEASGPRKINIVLNWFEELKQRVPVK